ncbi:MAG: alpha-amylase family glycosyl hydrolase [Planctomycetia bacterium]|nr:alpha-amylase family glycosyl hydrolase [Planctomycetia bacterium]
MKKGKRIFPVLLLLASIAQAQNVAEKTARVPVEWLRSGVMYQINPRAFTPEGTLKAAEKRMPDVAKLGVTIVYLCPIFVADDDMDKTFWSPRQKGSGMENPKNPYRMKDYYHVDPEYGTDDDLKSFVKTCHSLGMRVMLDLVYLHCGPKAVFLQEHPDFVKRDKDGKIINAAWAFPGLNFESKALREYLWDNMLYYLREFDVDGYRMDVADGIPLDFWVEGRRRMEAVKPDVGTLAEGSRRENLEDAFDLNYGWPIQGKFPGILLENKPASLLRKGKEYMAQTPRGAQFMHCVDNHDVANESWNTRLEEKFGEKGMDAVLTFLFTIDGVPMLYCGQEIADMRRHSIFGSKGGCHIHWEDGNSERAQRRTALIQKLSQLRKDRRELTHGAMEWLDNDTPDDVVSFQRTLDDAKTVVVINFHNKPVETVVQTPAGEKKISLEPFGTFLQPSL